MASSANITAACGCTVIPVPDAVTPAFPYGCRRPSRSGISGHLNHWRLDFQLLPGHSFSTYPRSPMPAPVMKEDQRANRRFALKLPVSVKYSNGDATEIAAET